MVIITTGAITTMVGVDGAVDPGGNEEAGAAGVVVVALVVLVAEAAGMGGGTAADGGVRENAIRMMQGGH